MAKKTPKPASASGPSSAAANLFSAFSSLTGGATTGRFIVQLRPNAVAAGVQSLERLAGAKTFSTADTEGAIPDDVDLNEQDTVFEKLGFAVITAEEDAFTNVAAAAADAGDAAIVEIRPELIFSEFNGFTPALFTGMPITQGSPGQAHFSQEYLRGLRDGATIVLDGLMSGRGSGPVMAQPVPGFPGGPIAIPGWPGFPGGPIPQLAAAGVTNASGTATWGIEATRVITSSLSGKGVRVAILDTGLDMNHRDFAGRNITAQSFIPGESHQDTRGHGTHVAGTACGPKTSFTPQGQIRYGIAYEAELYIGKVLGNNGGPEASILAGIEWAIQKKCRVINMSLGMEWKKLLQMPPATFLQVVQKALNDYSIIGQKAIDNNCAIIAAAGNDSDRANGVVFPVSIPAAASKIMGVGAVALVNGQFRIANFSNRGEVGTQPGSVDLVGPGVEVFSATTGNSFATFNGTSMATPHVTGCAALMAQARPNWTAMEIMGTLMGTAKPLDLSSVDVGRGLVQAFQ
jgi:subtilisin family serine protease